MWRYELDLDERVEAIVSLKCKTGRQGNGMRRERLQ